MFIAVRLCRTFAPSVLLQELFDIVCNLNDHSISSYLLISWHEMDFRS
jgi:hypothetical protein